MNTSSIHEDFNAEKEENSQQKTSFDLLVSPVNWSALWDLLAGSIDIEKIVIKGEKSLHSGFKKHLDIMHNILDGNIEFRSKTRFKPFSYEILS